MLSPFPWILTESNDLSSLRFLVYKTRIRPLPHSAGFYEGPPQLCLNMPGKSGSARAASRVWSFFFLLVFHYPGDSSCSLATVFCTGLACSYLLHHDRLPPSAPSDHPSPKSSGTLYPENLPSSIGSSKSQAHFLEKKDETQGS